MGKGDRRRSNKMLRKNSQRKLKARIRRRADEHRAKAAASTKTEKKTRVRKPAASSGAASS